MKTEHESVQSKPDFSKKFVYAPLQYQPECMTSPMAGVFVDQLLMLEVLSASVPDDVLIYVKDHPTQWKPRGLVFFSYRYRGYYKAIAKLKNVRLVPIETDNYELIHGSIGVVTATGTPGWEALLRGKPAITFGYAWYRDCPGVFKVHDVRSCREAIHKVIRGVKITQQDIINYLASFQKVVPNLYREAYCHKVSLIGVEENVKNHVRILNGAIEKEDWYG